MSDKCVDLPPPTLENVGSTAAQLAESMGANETCKKAIDTSNKTGFSSTQGQAGGKLTGLFGTGVEAKTEFVTEDKMTEIKEKMQESGCGAIAINLSSISQKINNINCIVKSSMTDQNTIQTTSAKINIETYYADGEIDAKDNAQELATRLLETRIKLGKTDLSGDEIDKIYSAYLKPYIRDIDLSGGIIKQTVSGTVKTTCDLSEDSQKEIKTLQKQIASDVAETNVTTTLGNNASSPNTRSLTSSNQDIENNTINSDITEKINKVSVSQDTSGNINIRCAGNLNMKNIVIDNNVVANLITDLIVQDAIKTGVTASVDILNSTALTSTTESEATGRDLAELQDANADANTASVTLAPLEFSGGNGGGGGGNSMILALIIVVAIFVLYFRNAIPLIGQHIDGLIKLIPPPWGMVLFWAPIGIMLFIAMSAYSFDQMIAILIVCLAALCAFSFIFTAIIPVHWLALVYCGILFFLYIKIQAYILLAQTLESLKN